MPGGMREFSGSEKHIFDSLTSIHGDCAVIHLTATGLRKSTLDATRQVRTFLKRTGVHDFDSQGKGPSSRVIATWEWWGRPDATQQCQVSLFRPVSGNGDPRFWVSGLNRICQPDDLMVLFLASGRVSLINLTGWARENYELPALGLKDDNSGMGEETFELGDFDFIDQVWSHSTGGAEVASSPIRNEVPDWWPRAAKPAGVEVAKEWFLEAVRSEGDLSSLLFLVGGPGGGKSLTSSEIVKDFTEVSPKSPDLAHRSHVFEGPFRQVVLINDASISADSDDPSPLISDIELSVLEGSDFIACVNRGILVEEVRNSLASDRIGLSIVKWLSNGENELDKNLEVKVDLDYLKSAEFSSAQGTVRIVAVFVDSCSLLELPPALDGLQLFTSQPLASHGSSYSVCDWVDRAKIPLESTPVGGLLRQFSELASNDIRVCSSSSTSPFAANASNIANQEIGNSMLSVLRAAEIAAGQRFTFREIWGVFSRVLVGDLTQRIASRDYEGNLGDMPSGVEARFAEFQRRARYRLFMSLFGPVGKDENSRATRASDPVLRITRTIDPLLDVRPGFVSDSKQSGWATPLTDAFAGPLTEKGPLEVLLSSLPKLDRAHQMVTDFDRSLDEAFLDLMRDTSVRTSKRSTYVHWYSMYLHRFYAVANGIPAFMEQVKIWIRMWRMSPQFPTSEIERQILTILRPRRTSDDSSSPSLLPILDSRASPIVGAITESKIALRTSQVGARTSTSGEELFLEVIDHQEVIATVPLDFPLVRELDVYLPNHRGVTELSGSLAPRLERIRARSLKPSVLQRNQEYRIVTPDDDWPLGVRNDV